VYICFVTMYNALVMLNELLFYIFAIDAIQLDLCNFYMYMYGTCFKLEEIYHYNWTVVLKPIRKGVYKLC